MIHKKQRRTVQTPVKLTDASVAENPDSVRVAGKGAVKLHKERQFIKIRKTCRNIIRRKAGESLVEVLAGALLFLMMVAVLQGAVTFSGNAQQRSRQLRERNAQICRLLRETEYQSGGSAQTVEFKAVSADGSQTGTQTVFRIPVTPGTKTVSWPSQTEEKVKVVFYLFGPAAGGGGP